MHEHVSPNYDFILDVAAESADGKIRVLDFGCGLGRLVEKGRARGMDIWGVDSYAGGYEGWKQQVVAGAVPYVLAASDGTIPFGDESFDFVVANQVFEHVAEPPKVLAEIVRVLRPGGALLALFPAGNVWFEGHVGIYFAHRLRAWPRAQRAYLDAAARLGFGYYRGKLPPALWAERMQQILQTMVWYHRPRDVRDWWQEAFSGALVSIAPRFMRYRIARHPKLRRLEPAIGSPRWDSFLSFVCHRRAGLALIARKAGRAQSSA